jgi:hypothetical protein
MNWFFRTSERVQHRLARTPLYGGFAALGLLGVAIVAAPVVWTWLTTSTATTTVDTVAPTATSAAEAPVAPPSTAERAVQAQATAAAQAAITQAAAGVTARRAYGTKAGLALQRYADALGSFYEKNREARDRPALLQDTAWRFRTEAALGTMQAAATELTALRPVPDGMAVPADLFGQLAIETTLLRQDYADYAQGIGDVAAQVLPFPGTRTARAGDLVRRANVEVRRELPPA